MQTTNIEDKHLYFTVLRCRSWQTWPENTKLSFPQVTLPIQSGHVVACLHVYSYEGRSHHREPLPPICSNPQVMFKVMRDQPREGYWVGSTIVGEVGQSYDMDLDDALEPPRQGDVDITLHIIADQKLDRGEIKRFARPFSKACVSYINIVWNDVLLPVAPLQLRWVEDGQKKFEVGSLKVDSRVRTHLSEESLKKGLGSFMNERFELSPNVGRSLDVAMRRYQASFQEDDVVDEYCDLWEACEFATDGVQAKGGKVGRIAYVLSEQMKRAGMKRGRGKASVETKVGMKTLYETRGSLVHEALENPQGLREKTRLLNSIAEEAIRYRLNMPYNASELIESCFRDDGRL